MVEVNRKLMEYLWAVKNNNWFVGVRHLGPYRLVFCHKKQENFWKGTKLNT